MSNNPVEAPRPALVLGSGFHRHVFGDAENTKFSALYDWKSLLNTVAQTLEVAAPSPELSETQQWDTILLRAAKEGYWNPKEKTWFHCSTTPVNINKIELAARRVVSEKIEELSKDYPKSSRAKIPLNKKWGSIISLNFDSAWLTDTDKFQEERKEYFFTSNKIVSREKRRLTHYNLVKDVQPTGNYRRLWFPNGSSKHPNSIRMGLIDYGTAPYAIHQAHKQLEAWKIKMGNTEHSEHEISAYLKHYSEGQGSFIPFITDNDFPLTWIVDFLYRPLVFAGLSLSEQETGIWWLLAQKAKLNNKIGQNRPDKILVHNTDRRDFWQTNPFGLEPIFCDNWDKGWNEILQSNQ